MGLNKTSKILLSLEYFTEDHFFIRELHFVYHNNDQKELSCFREIKKENKDHETEMIDILDIDRVHKYKDYVQWTPIIRSCTLKLYLPRKLDI